MPYFFDDVWNRGHCLIREQHGTYRGRAQKCWEKTAVPAQTHPTPSHIQVHIARMEINAALQCIYKTDIFLQNIPSKYKLCI